MRVGYNKRIGVVFLILGMILGLLACVTSNLSLMGVLTPPALFGFGILLFTRTYFRVDEHALTVKALFGPATKTYRFGTPNDFRFEGGRVFIVQKAEQEMVRVNAWAANRQDWKAFRNWAARESRVSERAPQP